MLKKVLLAGAFAVAAPIAAFAAPIDGLINITGDAVSIDLTAIAGGAADTVGVDVDFTPDTGDVTSASGSFAGLVGDDVATLTDIDFSAPGAIWSVGGFTFAASSFHNFFTAGLAAQGFSATGLITAAGFDDTIATLNFSTQGSQALISFSTTTTTVPLPAGVLLMGTALAGFGVMRRRKDKKAA